MSAHQCLITEIWNLLFCSRIPLFSFFKIDDLPLYLNSWEPFCRLLEAGLPSFPPVTFKINDFPLHWTSWEPFCRLLYHRLDHGVDFWCRGQKMLNWVSWEPLCRLLEPRLENASIGFPWIHFIDFWSQCQKMLKSDFLGVFFSTSGAKARKCANRISWDLFSRLLEPRPDSA